MSPSLEDLIEVARTIWGEARGEPYEGMVAVAWVIKNRVTKGGRFGNGYYGVVHKHAQFSCWNTNDPNRLKIANVKLEDAALQLCVKAALAVLTGNVPDTTHGSTHYHTQALGFPTSWGEPKQPIITIGNHVFYNSVN